MISIEQCLKRDQLLTSVSDTARLDVELLLQGILKKSRAYLYAWPEKQLDESQYTEFEAQLKRRAQGEPIAYITGEQGFWSLDLDVAPCTLIPRPETETLVELALSYLSDHSHVLDLGTGTGAIALALASEFRQAHIEAVDLSEEAVALAISNARKHRLQNVRFYQSDWFENVNARFDLIVSNPPYLEADDPHLSQGDVRFEPHSALVSGQDGLDDIRMICREAKKHFFDEGVLMIEHGWNQGEQVAAEFAAHGYSGIETHKDFGGRDRVTLARYASE